MTNDFGSADAIAARIAVIKRVRRVGVDLGGHFRVRITKRDAIALVKSGQFLVHADDEQAIVERRPSALVGAIGEVAAAEFSAFRLLVADMPPL